MKSQEKGLFNIILYKNFLKRILLRGNECNSLRSKGMYLSAKYCLMVELLTLKTSHLISAFKGLHPKGDKSSGVIS